jgi:hypothetical protein
MKPLSILHVGTSDVPVLTDKGGALQRRILEMATLQQQDGHLVTVVSPSDHDGIVYHRDVRIELVRVRSRRPVRDYEFMTRVRRRLRDEPRRDILHAHGAPDGARLLGSRLAKRSVQSVDYFRYRATSTRIGFAYYLKSLNLYDAILPVSEYCRGEFEKFYTGLTSRVEVAERRRPDAIPSKP